MVSYDEFTDAMDLYFAVDQAKGIVARFVLTSIIMLGIIACCACACVAKAMRAARLKSRDEVLKSSMQRMNLHAENPQPERAPCVRVGRGVGFDFKKDQFEYFEKYILKEENTEFMARIVAGNQTWNQFNYEPDKYTTDLLKVAMKEKDETSFKNMFKPPSKEKTDDPDEEEHAGLMDKEVDEIPKLMVKAQDGLMQAIWIIKKPVWPTVKAELQDEKLGKQYLVDGREAELNEETGTLIHEKKKDDEDDDVLEMGKLVYLHNFKYVKYTQKNNPSKEHVALRGQISKHSWITIRSQHSTFAEKHPVFYTFEQAETYTQDMPFCKRIICYNWMILGGECRITLHLTSMCALICLWFVVWLPEGKVDKQVLFVCGAAALLIVILATVLYYFKQCCTRFAVPTVVSMGQESKESTYQIRQTIESISDISNEAYIKMHSLSNVGGAVKEAAKEKVVQVTSSIKRATGMSKTEATTVGKNNDQQV